MSENREDDAAEGGSRIEELPASDSDLAGEEQASRVSAPSPDDPDDARRGSPPGDPDEAAASGSPTPRDPYDPVA